MRLSSGVSLLISSLLLTVAPLQAGQGAGTPLRATGPLREPVVFVSRNRISGGGPGAVPGLGPLQRTAVVGGRLLLRDRSGKVRTLVDSTRLVDVSDPDVSWDGRTIVFSGIEHPDSSWRIYAVRDDGRRFRKITATDRSLDLSRLGAAATHFMTYDDFDPCFLPDGRIVFASTRYPSLASIGAVRASNLFVIRNDGTGLRRITTERNGAEEPTVDPLTGRIVYSRWWVNLDRPSNVTRNGLTREPNMALTSDIGDIWQAVTITPDGDGLRLYAGFVRTRSGTQTYKPSVMDDGRLLSSTSPVTSLVPAPGGWGIRWFARGAGPDHHIAGFNAREERRRELPASPPFALEGVQAGKDLVLFSGSDDGLDYGIRIADLGGKSTRSVIDFPGTLELDAHLLKARPRPPVIEDQFMHHPADTPPTEDPSTHVQDDFFRFDCMNIFWNGAVDEPMPDAPRITRKARIRFYMNPQRQNPLTPDPSILLKDAEVMYHGGVHEHDVPAEVPLFEQVVDSAGRVLGTTDGRFAHVAGFNFERQGAGTKCVGCHIGHSMLDVPINGSLSEWFNVAPSAEITASSEYRSPAGTLYPSARVVDRQARTGDDSVLWVAGEGAGARIRLSWPVPVEVRRFVLYGIPAQTLPGTSHSVEQCRIVLSHRGSVVRTVASTGRVTETGTSVALDPLVIDAAEVIITECTGTIDSRQITGLAEIEAVARLLPD